MSTAAVVVPYFELPWSVRTPDRKVFTNWLTGLLVIVTVCAVAIAFTPAPEVEREELEQLPPQLARIVLEKPKPAPPPPPPPEPEVKKEEPEPVPEEPKPLPKEETTPVPQPKVADAKEKAAVSGLLAFKDAFSDMRDAVDVSKLQDTGAIQRGAGTAATVDRSLLTSKHATRSAGVNVAALSRETGGVALAGRETTKVEAPEEVLPEGATKAPKEVDPRQRSIEEIRRVFDSNKGAIFAIYNRALRSNPALQGKVVLELVIDPNGRVMDCKVVATELNDEALVAKIINRIRLFDFGVRDVRTTTISYPVHFLPT